MQALRSARNASTQKKFKTSIKSVKPKRNCAFVFEFVHGAMHVSVVFVLYAIARKVNRLDVELENENGN